jgi:hypothetical protein
MTNAAPAMPPAFGAPDEHADRGIRSAVGHYATGLQKGDITALMTAFSDDAVVCGYIGDEGFVKPVTFLYRFVLDNPSPESQGEQIDWKIVDLRVAGDAAIVVLSERNYLGYDYATTLHLIHLGDTDAGSPRWWIVSKLFQGEPTSATRA